MRRIASLIIGALLITAAPVFAQAPTIPTTPNSPSIVGEVAQATQTLGVLTVVVLVVVFVLAAIVGFFVVAALRLGAPLVQTVQKLLAALQDANVARDRIQGTLDRRLADEEEAERSSTRLRVMAAETQKQTAAAQERTANILSDLETKPEASAGRKSVIETITQHVSEDGDKTREQLQAVVEKVIEAKQTAEKAATVEDLNKVLKPVLDKFDELSVTVRDAIRKVDTGRLDPAAVPDADPSLGSRVTLHDARLVPPDDSPRT